MPQWPAETNIPQEEILTDVPLKKIAGTSTQRSRSEAGNDERIRLLVRNRSKTDDFGSQWKHHSTVFMKRQVLLRIQFQDQPYRRIAFHISHIARGQSMMENNEL
jgi:hypothetical protein